MDYMDCISHSNYLLVTRDPKHDKEDGLVPFYTLTDLG
jgi:hypothetical protein